MFLLDLTHTSHTRARTGIQQVCRSLYASFRKTDPVTAITYDPYRRTWRTMAAWEKATLLNDTPAKKRGSQWPLRHRITSRVARFLNPGASALPAAESLIVPEVFSPQIAGALPKLWPQVTGPKVALFYDAIALKLPELTPPNTVARFPSYLRELLLFDGVAAISEDSCRCLLDYWTWVGVPSPLPSVTAIPLPLLRERPARFSPSLAVRPVRLIVLSVGTLEGRKNHLALLEACERLWEHGVDFELRLIGFAQTQTGSTALQRVKELQSKGRALRYEGAADEATLDRAYREATFTVYPSILEGFGLPVLESLAYEKPCICSERGALRESTIGGGCLTVDTSRPEEIAEAIASLVTNPARLAELTAEAARRTFRTWSDYQRDLKSWMQQLTPSRR